MKRAIGIAAVLLSVVSSATVLPALAAGLTSPVAGQTAGQMAPASASDSTAAPHNWTTEQLITASCHDAWLLSGKNEASFFEMVKALAEISADKRGITLPDNKEAGMRAGNWIKMHAKADPDQLLYVVVDQAVQHSARVTAKAAAAAPAAPQQ